MGDDDDAGGTTIRDLGVVSGTELVTNGTFQADSDWTKGTGWTISGGTASSDGSQSGSSDLYQDAGLALNYDSYTVTFTVSGRSAGSVRAVVGGSAGGTWRSADGTYTEQITVINGPNFYMQCDSSFVGSIDNVSVTKDNLIINGSMEGDDNWNDEVSPTTNERSTTQVYSGTYSRKCVTDAVSDGLKSDTFSVVAGTMYEVSLYYWLASGGAAGKLLARLQDGNGNDVDASHSLTATNTWTKYTFYTTATITGSSSYFKVYQNGAGASTFYLDNVSVKQVNGNPGTLVNTPTFSTDIP
jgi:hypothetical protein